MEMEVARSMSMPMRKMGNLRGNWLGCSAVESGSWIRPNQQSLCFRARPPIFDLRHSPAGIGAFAGLVLLVSV